MSAHAAFPRSRLAPRAELLLLLSTCAAIESDGPNQTGGHVQRRDSAKDAAMRAHAIRRSMVHYKCDNSAKV